MHQSGAELTKPASPMCDNIDSNSNHIEMQKIHVDADPNYVFGNGDLTYNYLLDKYMREISTNSKNSLLRYYLKLLDDDNSDITSPPTANNSNDNNAGTNFVNLRTLYTDTLILQLSDDMLRCLYAYMGLSDQARLARTCARMYMFFQDNFCNPDDAHWIYVVKKGSVDLMVKFCQSGSYYSGDMSYLVTLAVTCGQTNMLNFLLTDTDMRWKLDIPKLLLRAATYDDYNTVCVLMEFAIDNRMCLEIYNISEALFLSVIRNQPSIYKVLWQCDDRHYMKFSYYVRALKLAVKYGSINMLNYLLSKEYNQDLDFTAGWGYDKIDYVELLRIAIVSQSENQINCINTMLDHSCIIEKMKDHQFIQDLAIYVCKSYKFVINQFNSNMFYNGNGDPPKAYYDDLENVRVTQINIIKYMFETTVMVPDIECLLAVIRDESYEVVEYLMGDARIRVCDKGNLALTTARNIGLSAIEKLLLRDPDVLLWDLGWRSHVAPKNKSK